MAEHGPLCVGIDPHPALLAAWDLADDADGLRTFALTVVEALAGRVAALKPQSAFFERHGSRGVAVLEEVVALAAGSFLGAIVVAEAHSWLLAAILCAVVFGIMLWVSDERRRGHVGHAGACPHRCRCGAEVQWRVAHLVASEPPSSGRGLHARRHGDDARVGEVREQCVEPAGARQGVSVEERHERRLDARQSGVAGGCRSAVDRPPQHP